MTTEAPPPDGARGPAGRHPGPEDDLAARLAAAEDSHAAAQARADDELALRLRAESNARAADDARLAAESRVRELEEQLTALLDAQDAQELHVAAREEEAEGIGAGPDPLSLFDGPGPPGARGIAGDGRDNGVLPMALIGVAVVAGLTALLAFVSGRAGFGLVMLGVALLLAWLASRTWASPVEVRVERGIVYIDQGSTRHRFDIRSERTQVQMHGQPGDRDWEVRFVRGGLDPFVVQDHMVDAGQFVAELRRWRPGL